MSFAFIDLFFILLSKGHLNVMTSKGKSAMMWQNVITANVMLLRIFTLLSFTIAQQGNN